jgi:hypothetical protein
MSDLNNWKAAVDQCHQKHIGPPPALQRRIAYLEAHSQAARATTPLSRRARLKLFLMFWTRKSET